MELLNQNYGVTRRSRFVSNSATDLTKTQPVSKLIILQARFQQKQLQEKEEKLLKLYEEQQERAMNRVGGRVQSGGSSVSSTSSVGRGKVRQMFQTRRGTSESRQGRDRSYPLEPLKTNLSIRTHSLDVDHRQKKAPGSWSNTSLRSRGSLNRHNSDLQLRQIEDFYGDYDESDDYEEDSSRKGTVRRTQSQVRSQKPKSKLLYFGGSHTDLRFTDESDYVQTFQVIDDHYEIPDRDLIKKKDRQAVPEGSTYPYTKEDEYFISNFNNKRQFYENRLRSDSDLLSRNTEIFDKLPNVGMNRSNSMSQRKETASTATAANASSRYKTFVSQRVFTEKPHLGNGVKKQEVTSTREAVSPPPRQVNGSTISPAMKVRKPTPMPSSVAPKQHLLQTKRAGVPVRQSPTREMTPPVPASRTTVGRAPSTMPQSEKPPISKKTPRAPPAGRTNPQSDLPNCQYCGRHFAEDRISKHQEICKKSSKSKRKPFDSVKQRVKGTEAEQFLKGGKLKIQTQQKQVKMPQKDWRKTHEDFINSIRAAREYQMATTNQVRKPSTSRPSTGSRY